MLVKDPCPANIFTVKKVRKKILRVSVDGKFSCPASIKTMAQKVLLVDRTDYTRLNKSIIDNRDIDLIR